MFGKAVEQQQAALTKYAGALEVAGGDVTAPDVQDAATNLHAALQFLPIAHTAYAGVAFPTARADDPAPKAVVSPTRGEGALGVHPDMLTAICHSAGNLQAKKLSLSRSRSPSRPTRNRKSARRFSLVR